VRHRREVFLAPAAGHRLAVGALRLLQHRRRNLGGAGEIQREPRVLQHQLGGEGRREVAIEHPLHAAIEVRPERHAAAVAHDLVEHLAVDARLHAGGQCLGHRHRYDGGEPVVEELDPVAGRRGPDVHVQAAHDVEIGLDLIELRAVAAHDEEDLARDGLGLRAEHRRVHVHDPARGHARGDRERRLGADGRAIAGDQARAPAGRDAAGIEVDRANDVVVGQTGEEHADARGDFAR
jgi:hypothetical protein